MKSFQSLYQDYLTLSKDDSDENISLGKKLINYFIRKILTARKWSFDIKEGTLETEESVQGYALPYDCEKVVNIKITTSSTIYWPTEIIGDKEWGNLNRTTTTATSDA